MNNPSFSRVFHRGFTLIEALISIFVFLIIMTAVTNTFTSGFSSYKNTKIAQKNVENAQFALNLIAKELRTSSIVSPATTGTTSSLRFYDYSQTRCIEYQLVGNELRVSKRAPASIPVDLDDGCDGSLGTAVPLIKIGSSAELRFRVTPSTASPKQVGKVTISLQIQESATQIARIQTTVSLRDYGVSL